MTKVRAPPTRRTSYIARRAPDLGICARVRISRPSCSASKYGIVRPGRRDAIDDARSKLEAELQKLDREVKQEALLEKNQQGAKKRKGGMLILGDGEQSAKRMRIKQIRGRWLPALASAAEGKAIDANDEGMRQALSGVVGLGAIWEHQGAMTLGE